MTATVFDHSLAAVLLARRASVYLPAADPGADPTGAEADAPELAAGLDLLEADLLARGYLLSAPLRAALAGRPVTSLAAVGRELLAEVDHRIGADRRHVPLFRNFPRSIPHDTGAFFVDRVLTVLFQDPEVPCVLCGTEGTVHAVAPCAHLVCRVCFDGSDFSACPICHRRIDPDDPFLLPGTPRTASAVGRGDGPRRLRVLAHGGDASSRTADAGSELRALLARPDALSPQDGDDLVTLLDVQSRADLGWLPQEIPGRETKARVLAWLLADGPDTTVPDAPVLDAVAVRLDTVTDVLRLLAVRSGGDAGLLEVPRFGPVARPLRRMLLTAVDRLDPATAAEEMRRRRRLWIHAAERLHPFEQAHRHPRAALAFAALRGTALGGDRLSALVRDTAVDLTSLDASGPAVALRNWGGRVERALAGLDVPSAVALLSQRPGELVRRLDHLLRAATADTRDPDEAERATEAVLRALPHAVTRVAPAVLLSALGEIRTRTAGRGPATRVFFPKGGTARIHVTDEQRAPLSTAVVRQVVDMLTGEILRRAASAEAVPLAVVDAALDGLIAPFTQRTASRSLVTLPRGSEIPVPEGRTLRLFLHWMESETSGRVDLDLSLAMYDAAWTYLGTCDYTNLRFADAAVHSGDLTSAPPPLGATEFADLDLERLAATGARYAVAIAFSYNNVAFEDLAEGFAGLMVREGPGEEGPLLDPRAVEQRFDLSGRARAGVPMIIDTHRRTLRWLDVVKGVSGTNHSVAKHADDLAVLGDALTGHFTSGSRVGLGELAVWQAAARATTVLHRHTDGTFTGYRRRPDETAATFASRIGTTDAETDAETAAADPTGAGLAYLLRGDLPLPKDCEVFALYPAALDAASVRLLTAADVVAALAVD